jgi:thioesterase domain-containing protein/acyl carrier protein
MRILISGGEAVVCETARALLARLKPFGFGETVLTPGFGMTETCAGSIFSRAFPKVDGAQEFASLGTAVQGLEIRIADNQGDALPDGQIGELQLRGSIITPGYHNNAAATQASFSHDGWFRTGDLGMLRNGVLRLSGRSKDNIILNGVNYYSHEIETELGKVDGIESSYVAACPIRPKGSDTEQVAIFFHPSFPISDELRLHRLLVEIRDRLVLLWGFRPTVMLPLQKSDMPKTSLGKLQRTALRKHFEESAFTVEQCFVAEMTKRALGGYIPPESNNETVLVDIYADMFGLIADQISATTNFFDLGGTSLDIIVLKVRVERAFHIDVPTLWLMQYPTIRALAQKLSSSDPQIPAQYNPIVAFNKAGTHPPLFCVHPGLGEVLVLANLAKYFVHERPFYALRARGFNKGEEFFTSFAEMVETYITAIRSIQPHGPYYVSGYSYGDIVAFEIAKSLESLGEVVAFVGIFDLPPHIFNKMQELTFTESILKLGFCLNLITQDEIAVLSPTMYETPETEQIRLLIGRIPPKKLIELDLDEEKFHTWLSVSLSLTAMSRRFEPKGRIQSVTVFHANPLTGTKDAWLKRLNAWNDFTREKNRYVAIDGEHHTLMGPKHVATFQATLRMELELAQREVEGETKLTA